MSRIRGPVIQCGGSAVERGMGMDRGDDANFDDAFAYLFATAHRIGLRILGGDRQGAEDIAAEALARAYSHWPKIGSAPYRDAWVVRVASNLALNEAKRRPRGMQQPLALSIEDLTASRMALVEALRTLPRRQRDVVVLRHLSGLSEQEVAEALKIAQGTVKTHLRRGMEALRGRLADGEEPEVAT